MQDCDDVAWARWRQQRTQIENCFLTTSTVKTLESIVRADLHQEARWIQPVFIGGYNFVYVMELPASQSRVVVRLARCPISFFAREKASQESATMKFLSRYTSVSSPKLLSSGKHPDLGYYLILEFVENTGSLLDILSIPKEDEDEAPMFRPVMTSRELDTYLYKVAVNLQKLFMPTFSAVGSLTQDQTGNFIVGGRPITQNMYNMILLANIPASVLPAEDKTYQTANDWYIALAEMHMMQLVFQHNDMVKDADDCRNKYIARRLFLRLARAGKLSIFGFVEDTWSSQSKGPARGRCKAPRNSGRFRLWCDDFRPDNFLVDEDNNNNGTVIDWEFTYAAPTQFVLDPPWWLLLDLPEAWYLGLGDWELRYDFYVQVWLRVVRRREMETDQTQDGYRLSEYMQESWTTGRFWLNYAARKSWAFDAIFWEQLDERFFGMRTTGINNQGAEPFWKSRVGLLSSKERKAMEAFVDKKMKESQVRTLVEWKAEEAQSRMAEVLFDEEQALRQPIVYNILHVGHKIGSAICRFIRRVVR